MAVLKITKRNVDAAPTPAAGDAYHWDTELKGFGLRVTPKGVRSYVVQYRLPSRPARRMTIGIHGSPWTPEKARQRAEEILMDVKRGNDPVHAARKRARDAVDLEFSRYADAFVDDYLKKAWERSWEEGRRHLVQHVIPHLKGRPLPEIEKHEVARIVRRLNDRPGLARNVHATLRKLFAWAVDQGDLSASPIPSAPARVKARRRVLTPDEIVAAWLASFELEGPKGSFIRLLFATLQRRTEVSGVPWSEFSEMTRVWRLEGERAKNKNDHLVPLNALSVDVLNEMAATLRPEGARVKPWPQKQIPVFTSDGGKSSVSGYSKLKIELDRKMLPILQGLADKRADALGIERAPVSLPQWQLHDIRRTGTTQMQALGVPIEVTEKVINHKSGETAGIRGVYNLWAYEGEKREALEKWSAFLTRLLVDAEKDSNVIALPERAA